MDSTFKSFSFVPHILILLSILVLFLPYVKTNSDYSSLVYKKCANQIYTSSLESHSLTLNTLFQQLIEKSSHSKFSTATAGDVKLGISGFFQCRGDLGNDDCHSCLNTLPEASKNLCKDAVSARVQLSGCYLHYETDGFTNESSTPALLHQTCGEKGAVLVGFGEVRDAAFLAAESEMVNNGEGFYEGNYEYLHLVAQCVGDLGACDCVECISIAGQIAQEECGDSLSGQIYLDQCSLSYTSSPGGIPGVPYPEKKSAGNSTGKKAAIVLGGAAVLVAVYIFLRFSKCSGKKDDS